MTEAITGSELCGGIVITSDCAVRVGGSIAANKRSDPIAGARLNVQH